MTNPAIFRRLATATLATLLLCACGNSGSEADSATSEDAKIVGSVAETVVGGVTGMGVSTADLPDFAEVPPGAKAISNMAVNDGGKIGGSVSFQTTQSAADLVTFYREAMARNGLKIGMETQSPLMVQMLAESEDKTRSLMVMINVDDAGEASLNLVHSRAAN